MLLEKLQAEERYSRNQQRVKDILSSAKPSKTAQNTNKMRQLERETADMRAEVWSGKQLATAQKQFEAASLELYRQNMTPAKKQERHEDTRRMQLAFSRACL
jgi:hypothetical protein